MHMPLSDTLWQSNKMCKLVFRSFSAETKPLTPHDTATKTSQRASCTRLEHIVQKCVRVRFIVITANETRSPEQMHEQTDSEKGALFNADKTPDMARLCS